MGMSLLLFFFEGSWKEFRLSVSGLLNDMPKSQERGQFGIMVLS